MTTRKRRWLRWGLAGAGVLLVLWMLGITGNTVGRYFGWVVADRDPEALAEMLRPFYRTILPEGEGPFPTALLFSGCDGPRDNLDRWAVMLNARGWAAVVVDSHGPRDYLDTDIWRLICAGQLLMGSERAGDVLVSIYDVRRMPFVDPGRLVLIGASHGGWAIMELLAFEAAWALPFSLAALPSDPSVTHPLDGVLGTILLYPYCGQANRSARSGWTYPIPVLFLLSRNDLIAPSGDCLAVAETLAANGLSVQTRVFDGVTHAFDQEERAPFSAFEFNAEATDEALRIGGAFLDGLLRP
jgi:dienelactone hydrolase